MIFKETRSQKLCVNSASQPQDLIKIESWSDADFAADKLDRKSGLGIRADDGGCSSILDVQEADWCFA